MKPVLFLLMFLSSSLFGAKIGLLVMATGKYTVFIPPLIESAEKYFCKGHEVTYFVFTENQIDLGENSTAKDRLVCLHQIRLGWPYDTMLRYQVYLKYRDILMTQDYLFACDADMLFVGDCGDEILGKRVATIHPGFFEKPGPHDETDPRSRAFIPKKRRKNYYAGGFYGGTAKEMILIAEINSKLIDEDLSNGIIPMWHDESYWNRYCVDYPPTVILSPSYCYPESWNLPCSRKLLALDKNHGELRQ